MTGFQISYIQSWTFSYIRLLDKSHEIILRGHNIYPRCYQPLELMLYFCKAFKQQLRCNQKGLQRLREFVLSETKLRSAESLNLWSQIIPFSKNQKEVLQPTCYLNTLVFLSKIIASKLFLKINIILIKILLLLKNDSYL